MRTLIIVVIALLVAGCTPVPILRIINNTPWTITIKSIEDERLSELKSISPNGVIRIAYDNAAVDDLLTLYVLNCSYIYRFHVNGTGVFNENIFFTLQLEPDMRLYFRKYSRDDRALSDLAAEQRPGYPVAPMSKTCL